MNRVYCWYSGHVFELDENNKCPECGMDDHKVYDADNCGSFTPLRDVNRGTHCLLPIGHPGSCSYELESILERIHES